LTEIKQETGRDVQRIRTDGGTEFVNREFDNFLTEKKIVHEKSPPYTPQCNGMAERENRTLVEKARSMLHARNLPRCLWAEAVHTAAYLLNRIPNRKETTKTPYEKWFEKRPTVEHLRIFGCDAYVHIPDQHRKKFDRKARKVIFVGYGPSNKMFRKRLMLIDGEEEIWMQTADKDEDNFLEEDIPDDKTEKRGPGRPPGSRNKIKVIGNPLKMELRSKSTERTAMLAAADPLIVLKELVKKLDAEFEITVGDPSNFVGLEIYRDRSKRTIAIGQKNYIRRVLLKFNMESCKSVATPGDPSIKLSKDMAPSNDDETNQMQLIPYQAAVGSLIFLMNCTRPDISFEVSKVAQFAENPGLSHWKAVQRIFRYIKGTEDLKLVYCSNLKRDKIGIPSMENQHQLIAFCDSDWAGDADNR
ncbi:Retrovirus-related Pol polyprotein from transposon TNT 1-94, partial [Trichinella zimbabwensis]